MIATPSPRPAAELVAELIAAHQTGDREQERRILRELRDDHGLRIGFASKLKGGLE